MSLISICSVLSAHLQTEMFQPVVLKMERVHSGSVRLALLPAGVEDVGDPFQAKVGGLLYRVVVANRNVPDRGVRFVVSQGETIEVKPTQRTVADER